MFKNAEPDYEEYYNGFKERDNFRNNIESISDIMVAYTAEGGRFIGVSEKLLTLLGYKEKELLNKNIWSLTYNRDIEKEKTLYNELFVGLRPSYNIEKRVQTKSGETKWFYKDAFLVRLNEDSKKCVFNYMVDITERKKVEEELRLINEALKEEALKNLIQLEEARDADKIKNEFLANISHELRTPLNVIMGTLQLFTLYKYQDCGQCNINKHIKIMRQNCYRLLRLINNLIDLSKIDAGFFKIRPKKCNIVKTVEDITLSVAEYIESKGLSLVFDTDVEEKIICCDRDQIERIVLNLLANSIKFTEPGGCISVNIESENDSVKIIVRDTGIGIPQNQLSTIFDRFKQVGSGFGGSGIGLSLVKSLVELHGGDIKVESEENHGTEFTVTLHVDGNMISCEDEKCNCANEKNYETIKIEFSDIYPE